MKAKKYKVILDTVDLNVPEFAGYLLSHKIRIAKVQAGAGGGGTDAVTFVADSKEELMEMIEQFYFDRFLFGLIKEK